MMKLKSRYHILPDRCARGAMVFDAETGAIRYPNCGQDLAAFYYYLVGRGRIDESQGLLADVMADRLPISRMRAFMSHRDRADA